MEDKGNRTGLILEGGAMRGLFSAGVMDVLMENHIDFDGVIGVSAGACFGCNYKSGQIGRVIRYNTRFAHDSRYCSVSSWIKTGDLYNGEFCYHTLPERYDPMDLYAYKHNPQHFFVVMTDVESGKPVYKELCQLDENDLECIRASASMPIAAKPVNIDGHHYLDGGISDPIPIQAFEQMGYTKNVIVLTQPRSYQKSKQKAMGLMKVLLKDTPAIVADLEERHTVYNRTLAEIRIRESTGDVFVIAPSDKLPIGKVEHDPDVMRKVYREGRSQAFNCLEGLKRFLYEQ